MTKHPIEVITSVERRRRWSRKEKEQLVAACLEPDAVISEIARAAGIHISQLFRWRKELCQVDGPLAGKHVGAGNRV
jgi:transposase